VGNNKVRLRSYVLLKPVRGYCTRRGGEVEVEEALYLKVFEVFEEGG